MVTQAVAGRVTVLSLAILLSLVVFLPQMKVVEGQTTVVSMEPAKVKVALNQIFTVDINITDVADLFGYEVTVWFKNSVLQAVKAERPVGHFMTPNDPEKLFVAKWEIKGNYNVTHGRIWLSVILLMPETGKTGSGILARLTFRGIKEASTPLVLDPVKLSDSNAQSIDKVVNNGLVSVGNVVTVPDDYPTVQEGVNGADLGDRVYVRSGTYRENVVVNKTVSLLGESEENTIVDGSGEGNVVFVSASNVEIRGFTIQNGGKQPWTNWGACVQISVLSNNSIVQENILKNTTYGIEIEGYNATVLNNVIKDNYKGIGLLFSAGNNTIKGNTIMTSIWYGVEVIYSINKNTIVHNNFMDNSQQVYITGSIDVWDNGAEGNYFSNYNGTDPDGDGVGNTPYIIDLINQDNCPLMGAYMRGDVNHDEVIDIFDCVRLGIAFGSHKGEVNWNPHCDLNEDGMIDIFDMVPLAVGFGKRWTSP